MTIVAVCWVVLLVTAASGAAEMPNSESSAARWRLQPWLDPGRPVLERVSLLLPHLTLEEKVAQLGRPNAVTPAVIESGVGLLMHTTYCCGQNATATVRARNALQQKFLSTGVGKRLGVPASWRSFINRRFDQDSLNVF